jgi:hypothetical protein
MTSIGVEVEVKINHLNCHRRMVDKVLNIGNLVMLILIIVIMI